MTVDINIVTRGLTFNCNHFTANSVLVRALGHLTNSVYPFIFSFQQQWTVKILINLAQFEFVISQDC